MKALANGALMFLGLFALLLLVLTVFGQPPFESVRIISSGAFGDRFGLSRTLVKMTPLLLCGLGVILAWRAQMYNIGGEGQYVMGGLLGAAAAKMFSGSQPLVITLAVLSASIIGGSAYAAFAGWLQIKRGVQVVISTILLNFIAVFALQYCVQGPLKSASGGLPQTDALPDGAMLHRFDRQTDLHGGVFIALILAIAAYVLLFRTKQGFQIRLVGESPGAARAARIPADRWRMVAMALSGAFCGLAGGIEFCGISGRIDAGFPQQWGFLAIPAALLGGLHPIGLIFSAFFFGALFAGSVSLARTGQGADTLIYVIQAAAVLGYAAIKTVQLRRASLQRAPE